MNNFIYLSGKMTGLDPKEYTKQFELAETIAKKWFHVESDQIINPVNYGDLSYTWNDNMKEAVKVMMLCDKMILLPNFYKSRGAMVELNFAIKLGYEIYLLDTPNSYNLIKIKNKKWFYFINYLKGLRKR